MRAGIYVRISDDRDHTGLGVARQEKDAADLCARNGWTVSEVYSDNDMSAYSGKPRPAYRRMLADLDAGRLDVIVAWANDRLHRHPRELEDFIEAVERNAAGVHTVTSGQYDLATPEGRAMARVVGAMARQESERKSVRNRRKHVELAEAGKVGGGGTRPFGFEPDRLTVREDEAVHIRDAVRRVIAGERVLAIAKDWNERGISTATGKTWRSSPLRNMLRSGRIAGLRYHRGELVGPAVWPAIITPDEHERVRAILHERAQGSKYDGRGPRRYVLTGLLHCARCGARMVARPRQDGKRKYVCAKGPDFDGCGRMASLADPLEDEIRDQVLAVLDGDGLAGALETLTVDDDGGSAAAELQKVRTRRDELAAMFAGGDLSRSEWNAARGKLVRRIDELEAALSRTDRAGLLAGLETTEESLRETWDARDVLWRAAFLSSVLERVVLHPAVKGRNYFDPDRVEPVWRF